MIFHFSNAYQIDSQTIVVEAPAFEKTDIDPLNFLMSTKLSDAKEFAHNDNGSKFKRFTINLREKTVQNESLLSIDNGHLDLPTYNKLYDGYKPNRYTYML